MTIVAGFCFSQGVLLCADTQNTYSGLMKLNASKIVRHDLTSMGGGQIIFALTGSVAYSHMAIEHCLRRLTQLKPPERTGPGMRVALEDALEAFHQAHMYQHPEFHRQGGPDFQLLVAARSDADRSLTLYSTCDSAVSEITEYECLGAGSFLAHYLVPTIYRHSKMSLKDMANIAIHVLRETKEYVEARGGNSEFVVLDKDGKMTPVTFYDISTGETLSRGFRESMRRLFVVTADLDSTDEEVKDEFDLAFSIIQSFRQQQISERESRGRLFKALEDGLKMRDKAEVGPPSARKGGLVQ
jgi:20S proteasome alpha/beta subunit